MWFRQRRRRRLPWAVVVFFLAHFAQRRKKKKIEKLQNQATTQPTTLRRPRSPQALQRLWLRRQQPRPEALLWARA